MADQQPIVLALSKGRILEQTLPLLAKLNIHVDENVEQTRKLLLNTSQPNIKLLILRATDTPVYVKEGVADIGIIGKDILLESGGDGLAEYMDLKIAPCRLCIASLCGKKPDSTTKIRVATKYAFFAQKWFAEQGQPAEIIKLYGSMELAPLVGLSDYIVDIVETGNTLKAHGLKVVEDICPISSRLVFNPNSQKTKSKALNALLAQFSEHSC